MEDEADSRIVSRVANQWQLEQGPFIDTDFLRDGEWSLLVQRVNEWFPEVDALRGCVDFLPTWRFDDVMVSYATDGAGVGPHFDQYDVFLLQGAGQRIWKVGPHCDATTPTIDADGLTLIEEFDTDQVFLLNPGDALYIPPGYAHWGTAVGESMTYSLGFRAPRVADLVARLSDSVIESLRDGLLLEDKGSMRVQPRPGEITDQHLANAQTAVVNAIEALVIPIGSRNYSRKQMKICLSTRSLSATSLLWSPVSVYFGATGMITLRCFSRDVSIACRAVTKPS